MYYRLGYCTLLVVYEKSVECWLVCTACSCEYREVAVVIMDLLSNLNDKNWQNAQPNHIQGNTHITSFIIVDFTYLKHIDNK